MAGWRTERACVPHPCGGSAGARTRDLSIKSRLLYQLSYGPSHGSKPVRGGARAGQPGMKLTHCQPAVRIAPLRCDRTGRRQHESARSERRMRDGERRAAPAPPRPGDDVEVDHARPPAPPVASAERALDCLQPREQRRRCLVAGDQGSGVGEGARRRAERRAGDDRRRAPAEQRERRGDLHTWRPVPPATVRAECDEID